MSSGSTVTTAIPDASASVEVRVLLFSVLREHVGAREVAASLPAPATGETLLDEFFDWYPDASDYRPAIRIAVNEQYVSLDTEIQNGDDVALITPVSGG